PESLALSPDALFFRSRLASGKALHPANPWFCHPAGSAPPVFSDFSPSSALGGCSVALVSSVWFFTGDFPMHIHTAQPLFAWGCLDDCPTLVTIRDFLDTVPDQALLAGLRAARGHGRDDYPV